MSHTPGPWIFEDGYVRANGNVIADVYGHDAREANARLIASAPDLLKLRNELNELKEMWKGVSGKKYSDLLKENEELKDRSSQLNSACGILEAKIGSLESLNAELLEALKKTNHFLSGFSGFDQFTKDNEILIAKVEKGGIVV
jgi:predicted nuclease with TOPRIM domain